MPFQTADSLAHSLLGFLAVWWGRRHLRQTMMYRHFRGRSMSGAGNPLNSSTVRSAYMLGSRNG